MKRALAAPYSAHFAVFFLLCLLLPACVARGQADTLSWVNRIRRAAGVPAVAADGLLSETARRWALRLAEAGVLSHRGADGSSALDRYRAMGGTEVHVGEILGVGPSLADVEKGWMGSNQHRLLALDGAWTHVGWGAAPTGAPDENPPNAARGAAQTIYVVLFCEKLVDGLQIEERENGVQVSGRFTSAAAVRAMLYSGLDSVQPAAWESGSRFFRFDVSGPVLAGYLRLGYVSASGAFRLTNAFTLPRETGSPGAQSRSAEPAASP